MRAVAMTQYPTENMRANLRQRRVAAAQGCSVQSIQRALEQAHAELAAREERVPLLRQIADLECGLRFIQRTSFVQNAEEMLALEEKEVAYLVAAIRGLQATLDQLTGAGA